MLGFPGAIEPFEDSSVIGWPNVGTLVVNRNDDFQALPGGNDYRRCGCPVFRGVIDQLLDSRRQQFPIRIRCQIRRPDREFHAVSAQLFPILREHFLHQCRDRDVLPMQMSIVDSGGLQKPGGELVEPLRFPDRSDQPFPRQPA